MKTQVYVAVTTTTTTAADDDPIKWYEEVNQSLKREHPASLPSSHHATETQEETTTRYGRGIRLRRRKTGSHLILRIQSMSAVLIKFFSFSGARSSSGGRFLYYLHTYTYTLRQCSGKTKTPIDNNDNLTRIDSDSPCNNGQFEDEPGTLFFLSEEFSFILWKLSFAAPSVCTWLMYCHHIFTHCLFPYLALMSPGRLYPRKTRRGEGRHW